MNPTTGRVLLLAIVQHPDADDATRALTTAGLRATRISSLGGFLGTGNVTLLSGMERESVPRALKLLAQTCRTHTHFVNPSFAGSSGALIADPVAVEVGGATVLVLGIERMLYLGGARDETPAVALSSDASHTKLVVAVIPAELVELLVHDLTTAQYRATLISTTGGFLRKGNATLLIGVEAAQVDDVVQRITVACPPAAQTGSKVRYATVFVLSVESSLRV